MSASTLFDYVRLRYAELIGQVNKGRIMPPDMNMVTMMTRIDLLIKMDYRQRLPRELDNFAADISNLDVFMRSTSASGQWALFQAQAQAYMSAERDDLAAKK